LNVQFFIWQGNLRVTRLGKFSPFGWFVTLDSFLNNAEVAHILGLHFFTVKFNDYL
jgi:hypothetical protein